MARKHAIKHSMSNNAFYQHIFKLYNFKQNKWKKNNISNLFQTSILFRAMADSKGYYQYGTGDNWNQQHPDAGKNLWLGQRSCSHNFGQIVALVKGRWPMVDKNFSTGGYLWVLTGDKAAKSKLKGELEAIGGFNFGRESDSYLPATAHTGVIGAPPDDQEYSSQQWKQYFEEQQVT